MGACSSAPQSALLQAEDERSDAFPGTAEEHGRLGAHSKDDAAAGSDLKRQEAAERLTPAKLAFLAVAFVLCALLTVEIFREALRIIASADGSIHERSDFNKWMRGNAIELTSTKCLRESVGRVCPLFEPMGECSRDSDAFRKAHAYSIAVGHTVDEEPGSVMLYVRMLTNAVHLFGACSVAWFALAMYTLGGGMRAVTPIKLALVHLVTTTEYSMLLTGSLLLWWRRSTEIANFSPNITAASNPMVGLSGWGAVWHNIGRTAYQVAFVLGFATTILNSRLRSEPTWLYGNRAYARLVYVALAISVAAQCLMWPVMISKLFILNYWEDAWSANVHMIAIASLYPVQDAANVWALYWADYRGKAYDWAAHGEFNHATFLLSGLLTVIALTIVSGPEYFFSGSTPVAFRIAVYVPILAFWAVYRGWPHFIRLAALPKAPAADAHTAPTGAAVNKAPK